MGTGVSIIDTAMHTEKIEDRLDWFVARCKGLGMKITPQRVAIYRELAGSLEHPSAENIYNQIKHYYPNVSLTTVYRTLETFEKQGIISVVNSVYNAARYDANLTRHNHRICVNCRKLEDVYDESLNSMKIKSTKGFKVLRYSVLIDGICEDCRAEAAVS